MLSTRNWGNQSKLAHALTGQADTILLEPAGLHAFPLGPGEHFYLTLRAGTRKEVVRVVGATGTTLSVERGQDNTVPQSWPVGTCISFEWNPQQLREFIEGVNTGVEPVGITPGTYCLNCTTCLEIDGAGRVVSINGAEEC